MGDGMQWEAERPLRCPAIHLNSRSTRSVELIKPARSSVLPCRIDYLFVDFSQRIDFQGFSLRLSEKTIQQAEVAASDADDGHGRIFGPWLLR